MDSLNYVKSKLSLLFIYTTLICLIDNLAIKICLLILCITFLRRALLIPLVLIIFVLNIDINTERPRELVSGEDIFVVEEISNSSYIVSNQGDRYSFISENKYEYKDTVKINYNASWIDAKRNFYEFDYQKYMNRKGVYQTLYPNTEELISSGFDIRNPVINNINKIEDDDLASWVKMITLGMKDRDKATLLSSLGISHIFAISGFHIGILYNLFKKVIKNNLTIICILFAYVYLTGLGVGSIRAWLFILIGYLNTQKSWMLSKVDTLAISYIMCLIYSPNWVFEVSFYLSFAMTLAILVLSVYKLNTMNLAVGLFSFSLPIILTFTNEVNILAPLVVVIATPLFMIIYPLTLILMFLPTFNIIGEFVKFILNDIILYLDKLYIPVNTGVYSVTVALAIILILVFYYSARRPDIKKFLISIFVVLNLGSVYEYTLLDFEIHMINVGQSECILIRSKNNNFLIDVGAEYGGSTFQYNIEPYLKNLGINKIDKVFISHDDYDHSGSLEQLVENFNVQKVYRNDFEDIHINNISIKQLNTFNWGNKNDDSQVIEIVHKNKNYLFTGDISTHVEDKLVLKNNYEVLKVAHHGSNTSTGNSFKYLEINHAIISAGENNYGHPHPEVIANLEGANIYLTRDNGTIIYQSNLIHNRIKTLY